VAAKLKLQENQIENFVSLKMMRVVKKIAQFKIFGRANFSMSAAQSLVNSSLQRLTLNTTFKMENSELRNKTACSGRTPTG
jgi:hypothetical protein